MSIIDVIGTDRNIIPYRPELRKIAGSINATILLQQIIYYCSSSRDGKFYKFKSPCSHAKYVVGDSWIEKLGFSEKEFEGALANIGYKKGKSKNSISEENALIFFYTDMDRCTWYSLNEPALNKALNELYVKDKKDFTYSTKGTLRKEQKGLYIKDEKADITVKDKKDFTIHTEINKEEIHKEVVADFSNFSKNEKEDSEKPAETFFQKELQEVKEYFSESSEKVNLPLETENQVTVENLPDFENQSKEIEVFSKENKMPAKKSKEIFFSETNYFSDAELFSQDLLKRFPHYEKYDLQQYHTSAVNWGQGKPIAKYKKSDWILTVKTWIDCDIKKGVATLKWQTKPLQSQKINTMGDLIDQEQRVNEFLIMQERQKQQEKQANGTNGTYTHSYELIC